MKTKKIFVFLLICISMGLSNKSSASVVNVYLDNTNNPEWHYFCSIDTIIVHKPSITAGNFYWDPPIGSNVINVDSVIITAAKTGTWYFHANNVYKDFYVYIISSGPYEPTCMVNDTSICTSTFSVALDAQNQNPGGQAATYLWSTGDVTQTITATTPGTYSVTVTNACGSGVYSKIITQANPNAPNLGVDQTFCLGSSSVLITGSSNIASCLWSTGATTNTLTVTTGGTYSVYVIDNNGCSGYDTIQITTITTPSQEILLATINVDPLSSNYGNNKITWDVDPLLTASITTVDIYRESGTSNYILMGTANYTDGEWSDVVNSTGHAWKYKISLVGPPCGEGSLSSSVQTIHCWVSPEIGGGYTIQWDPYIVGSKSTVSWYKVLSGNGLNQLIIRDSISGTLTSLTLPNTTDSIFVVGAELSGAKSIGGLALSNKTSNPVTTSVHTVIIQDFAVFPNPATNQLNIDIGLENFEVNVFTMLGQVILTEHNTKVLNVNNLAQGMYIISITANNHILTNQRFIKD
jgi:hypothetical protein